MITAMIGTFSSIISRRFTAIASAICRSSAPMPGYAPAVSISVIIGSENLSAIFIRRNALR